ncbi:hypothetical protein Cgig2_025181 [Carnegiea gigantea]|uniref:glutathione transferase n=1 Tax=Carnegiea gigantea TaxID=171969 RepID=A0A9Q1QN13_9CARY|nr:hypothetical protein Cgig2_025181 [Carnegiea gigantea]
MVMTYIKVLGLWASPYSFRVEKALKMKGVEYESVEIDIMNKTQELLDSNPVHKKVPVLLHTGKPIAESLVIMEYIDQVWKGEPLLPSDPYERAQARFWAKFIDDQLTPAARTAVMGEGEDAKKAREAAEKFLKILDEEIRGGNKLFEGKAIGYLDLVGLVVTHWFPVLQEAAGKELVTKDDYPAIWAWGERLLGCPGVKDDLPPWDKLLPFFQLTP